MNPNDKIGTAEYTPAHHVCEQPGRDQLMAWLILAIALALIGLIMPEPISIALVFFALGVLLRSVAIDRKQK